MTITKLTMLEMRHEEAAFEMQRADEKRKEAWIEFSDANKEWMDAGKRLGAVKQELAEAREKETNTAKGSP